jgi:methionine-gamma-lyase
MSDPVDRPTPRRKPKREVTTIGGRTLKPSTLMMGYGYDPVLSEGALKPPIFLTSTFVFESAEAGKRHFEGITGQRAGGAEGLVYSRFNGPNQEILEDRLASGTGRGRAGVLERHDRDLHPADGVLRGRRRDRPLGPLYAASEGFIASVLSRYGVSYVDFPAGRRARSSTRCWRRRRRRPSIGRQGGDDLPRKPGNPTNALVDIEAVRDARDAALDPAETPIAIDNTFLGPLWQSPLKHGADIVAYSLTKYAGGHSDLVAGGVSGAKAWMDPVRALRNTMGGICDPNTAWMLLRSLETLEIRMQRATANAVTVCGFLKDHPKVEGLGFLGLLPEGSQKDIYRRHCTGPGSTFSLFIRGGEAEAFRFLDSLRIAKLAVSLGGTETLASHPAAMTHLSVPPSARPRSASPTTSCACRSGSRTRTT